MPHYLVDHTTRFTYSAPITESVMEVRMEPRSDNGQHCLSFELQTRPSAKVFHFQDERGNHVRHFDILIPHERLELRARAAVSIDEMPGFSLPALDQSAWEALDREARTGHRWSFRHESHFARFSPSLHALAETLGVTRRTDPATLLFELNGAIYDHFEYMPATTTVDSPLEEVIATGQGVCQDFAHVMVALGRLVGIPCRYVSGYLFHRLDGGDRSADDATHAWIEAWLPEAGWVGFDPTNKLLTGERHIRCAIGRDYADVPPTRGLFKGDATSELTVAVQVTEVPALPKTPTPATPSNWATPSPTQPAHAAAQAQQ